jgi:hypothetical protein
MADGVVEFKVPGLLHLRGGLTGNYHASWCYLCRSLGFPFLLFSRRKQHVIQDKPVTR